MPEARREALHTALALAVVAVGALVLATGPAADLRTRFWGPETAWSHMDFLGTWWMLQASPDLDGAAALLRHPVGGADWRANFPNPWDAWLLGPLLSALPFPLGINLWQLCIHLGNVLAATWLCRAAGARAPAAAAAGLLVAACPVMQHEVAGGRTISGLLWPGLLGLGLHLRGRSAWAGLLIGLQGACYVYAGLAVGVVALILRFDPRLFTALVPMAAYVAWLVPSWSQAVGNTPPAGHTSLPLSGLLGLDLVPERFRMNPVLLAGAVAAGATKRWRWLAAIGLLLALALGPSPTWALGKVALFPSPVAWLLQLPGLSRMHHPVRHAMLLAPLLAVPLSLALGRLPSATPLLAALLALPMARASWLAVGWPTVGPPPGLAAATWIATQPDGAVVDLTGGVLQPLAIVHAHGRPILQGLRPDEPPLLHEARAWTRGDEVEAATLQALRDADFRYVLVVARGEAVPEEALTAQLGAPIYRDEEAGVWGIGE
ncbi:MAG: hypothetical protein H6742_19840 [Alphaproteobacteria bacterium]|nr:hypothetical protein [Alphaproteobacteria bacterium]